MILTDEQRRILDHGQGPIRIAAGAGTGKTGTLQQMIVRRIEASAKPEEIVCLTFTVEATQEMRRRVLLALADRKDIDPDELTVQTYHAFAAAIVREHALLLGLEGDAALLDRARQWQLSLEALDHCEFDGLDVGWVPSFVGKVLTLNEEMLRHVVAPGDVLAWCDEHRADAMATPRREALKAVESYRELKRQRNAIDFGDQIALAVELLRTRPQVLERLRARYRYVFLDEYQDTDVAQRELVKLVAGGAELVCAVGDVDQGIFGWRGASIHNMFAFADDFPGTKLETLSVNFRSGQRILDIANTIIAGWQRPGDEFRHQLRPADGASVATVEAFVSPHQIDEAEEIARRIADSGQPWSQYAVLARQRSLFEPIYRALRGSGINVEVDVLGGFWTRPEILDLIAWLRILDDPGDNLALTRLLLGPAYRLSKRDLYFLAEPPRDENRRLRYGDHDILPFALSDSIIDHPAIANLSEEARDRIDAFHATWRELMGIATRATLSELVGEIARVSGLATELASSTDPEAELALRHLAKLRDLARNYQPVAGALDLAGFVDYLDSLEDSEQDEDELRATEPNAVKLMTLHRAKGLEWDVVFLPGLAEGQMPHRGKGGNNPANRWERLPFELRGDREFLPQSPATKEDLDQLRDEEERRLMYVGITRARRRLVLSRAWYYRDNIKPKAASIYWDEIAAAGLLDMPELECPTTNPHPVGAEPSPKPQRPIERAVANPLELGRLETDLKLLRTIEAQHMPPPTWSPPATLSVTAFLTFVHDPEEFYWRYVRRTPSPPSPAAQLGTELHHRIEQHARGQVALGDVVEETDEQYDLDVGERRGGGTPVTAVELWANFEKSRFAAMTPLMVEQPFTLYIGDGLSLEGRIDAVYECGDGSWEVIDYKTGRTDPDPLQLGIYSLAIEDIWGKKSSTAWLLLRTGAEIVGPTVDNLKPVLRTFAAALRQLR